MRDYRSVESCHIGELLENRPPSSAGNIMGENRQKSASKLHLCAIPPCKREGFEPPMSQHSTLTESLPSPAPAPSPADCIVASHFKCRIPSILYCCLTTTHTQRIASEHLHNYDVIVPSRRWRTSRLSPLRNLLPAASLDISTGSRRRR
jgi:hypothetical protein